ncbi:MAG: redoxin domain-containing protein [Candidatus Glassbacteria bacterium]|nr:redoxin domain-containing protein [Candidatus Glassbacteria bacterium]
MLSSARPLLIVSVLSACLCSISLAAPEPIEPLPLGSKAPAFSLPGADGRTWTLEDFSDTGLLVIVFTTNHCPTAQAYEERIKQLTADYAGRGVAVVAISPNDPRAVRLDELGYTDLSDSFPEMVLRARQHGFNFPYLYDGDSQEVSKAYGPQATPHVFIFDSDRRLRYSGRIDNNEKPELVTSRDARAAIDALLAGEDPPLAVTKTFGCSVKWASKRGSVQDAFERWAAEEVAVSPADLATVGELLANDSGKYRLVNIWATWCGPCVVEFPNLVEINRMYRNRPFELVTISADSPAGTSSVLDFLRGQQASCTNYHYTGEDKYALIEAVDPEWPGSLPYTLLVAPGGEVLRRWSGQIEPQVVKTAVVEKLGRYYE